MTIKELIQARINYIQQYKEKFTSYDYHGKLHILRQLLKQSESFFNLHPLNFKDILNEDGTKKGEIL